MPAAPAASVLLAALGVELGSLEQDAGNRLCFDGLSLRPGQDGAEIALRSAEATSLRLAAAPLVLEIGRLALRRLAGQLGPLEGQPRLHALQAAEAELAGVKLHGPLVLWPPPKGGKQPLPAQASASAGAGDPAGSPWSLEPLAAAQGELRARIVDAHLLFDADVTVPIRQGQVDFNDASVEHVGPDSRMGVSRLGIYVDAPNGRSYLHQFPAVPVGGVEYERRGALLGPFVTDRGKLQLQAFTEGLLRQARAGQGLGLTEQARLLLERTAMRGSIQLGDGKLAAPGVQAEMVGAAEGRNTVRVNSEAVARGLVLEIPALSLRHAALRWGKLQVGCDTVTGALLLRLFFEGSQLRFALELANLQVSGLRLDPQGAPPA